MQQNMYNIRVKERNCNMNQTPPATHTHTHPHYIKKCLSFKFHPVPLNLVGKAELNILGICLVITIEGILIAEFTYSRIENIF